MSFSGGDLKLYKPATPAIDFTTSSIGGAKSANLASAANLSEICFLMPVDDEDQVQYAKAFIANDNAEFSPTAVKVWLKNALDDWGENDVNAAAQGDAAGDDDGKFVRFFGHDTHGDPVSREVLLDEDEVMPTSDTLTKLQSVELRDQATGALVAAAADVKIFRNSTLIGVIPEGAYSATAEFAIWLPASLNDTTTASTAASSPSGGSFTRPRTELAALSVANGGVLTAGTAQGIWYKWALAANAKSRGDVQVILGVRWNDPV